MDTPLGWMFLGIAALFSLGLVPPLAGRFYPTRPRFVIRLAAPVIFGFLTASCFAGFATPALYAVAVAGTVMIVYRRRVKVAPLAAPEVAG
jgi:hypothetical protein